MLKIVEVDRRRRRKTNSRKQTVWVSFTSTYLITLVSKIITSEEVMLVVFMDVLYLLIYNLIMQETIALCSSQGRLERKS